MTELSPILAELERLYDVAVDLFWGGAVELKQDRPVITLASKGRNRTRTGWYNPGVWSDSQEDILAGLAGESAAVQVKRAEIVVATELLSDPSTAVAELCRQVAVHKQVSHRRNNGYDKYPDQLLNGLVGANGYYPERWTSLAWGFGCSASVDQEQPSRGWSKLSIQAEFKDRMEPLINTRVFDVARSNTAPTTRPGSRMKKWRCGCTTIRCATKVTAFCNTCGTLFTWAEANEPDPYNVRPQNADEPVWSLQGDGSWGSPVTASQVEAARRDSQGGY